MDELFEKVEQFNQLKYLGYILEKMQGKAYKGMDVILHPDEVLDLIDLIFSEINAQVSLAVGKRINDEFKRTQENSKELMIGMFELAKYIDGSKKEK